MEPGKGEFRAVRPVLLQILVTNLYEGTSAKRQMVRDLTTILPPRIEMAEAGATISDLISTKYGVGPQRSKAHGYIEERIRDLNGLDSTAAIGARTVLIPSLPPETLVGIRSKIPWGGTMKFSGLTNYDLSVPVQSTAFSEVKEFICPLARSTAVTLEMELPLNDALHVLRSPSVGKAAHGLSGDIYIRLANSAQTKESVLHQVLSDSEKAELRQFLTNSARRQVIVLIQDTGWPNPEVYTNSYRQMYAIMDHVWTNVFKLTARPSVHPRKVPAWNKKPSQSHCQDIERALAEFRALDHRHVKVVYLPMTREQNALPLLTEMIHIYLVVKSHDSNGQKIATLSASGRAEAVASCYKQARGIASALPAEWSSEQLNTDVAAVAAPFEILRLYGSSTQSFGFINQSWVVEWRFFDVDFPHPMCGMVVAAAGNVPGKNVIADDTPVDFVQRCQNAGDTVGVLNVVRGQRLAPNSSDFVSMFPDKAWVVGFDGRVDDALDATSFATPRIAWLLAAWESVRISRVAQNEWPDFLQLAISRSRHPSGAPDKFWLDPVRFIEERPTIPSKAFMMLKWPNLQFDSVKKLNQ